MNPEKYKAGLRLNELENRHKITCENVAKLEAALAEARVLLEKTDTCIRTLRVVVAAMPD